MSISVPVLWIQKEIVFKRRLTLSLTFWIGKVVGLCLSLGVPALAARGRSPDWAFR